MYRGPQVRVSSRGPQGVQGATGPQGPAGTPGAVTAISDTASVDLTLAAGTLSATVLPAGVDHGGLGGLGDDDHAQYPLLAGRAGGQAIQGGTGGTDALTLKPGGTGGVDFDLSAAVTDIVRYSPFTPNTTGIQTLMNCGDAISMGASARLSAFTVTSAVTWTASPSSIPYLVFNFNVPTNYDNAGSATNISARTATIYRDTATYGSSGAGAGTIKTGIHFTVYNQVGGAAALAGTTMSQVGAVWFRPHLEDVDHTWTDVFAVFAAKPNGTAAGTFTRWGGLFVDDPTGATEVITNAYSVYSKGAGVAMWHAGQAVFGALAAPTNASVGLEVQSTTRALLVSRMTGAQANALTPLDGMVVYVTDNAGVAPFNTGPGWFFRDAGAWVKK